MFEDEKGIWSFQGQKTMYLVIFYAQVEKFAQYLAITVNMLVKIVRKKSSKRGYTLNLVRDHKGRCKS